MLQRFVSTRGLLVILFLMSAVSQAGNQQIDLAMGLQGIPDLDKLLQELEQLNENLETMNEQLAEIQEDGKQLAEEGAEIKQEVKVEGGAIEDSLSGISKMMAPLKILTASLIAGAVLFTCSMMSFFAKRYIKNRWGSPDRTRLLSQQINV